MSGTERAGSPQKVSNEGGVSDVFCRAGNSRSGAARNPQTWVAIAAILAGFVAVALPASATAALDNDVTAGAQNWPKTGYLSEVSTCTHHVTTAGTSTGDGTQASPWSLEKAVEALAPGQTACVDEGTYTVDRLVPRNTGTEADPISIQAAPIQGDPGNRESVTIKDATDGSLFEFNPGIRFWEIRGLRLDKARKDGSAVQVYGNSLSAGGPVAIRDNSIRNGKGAAAVLLRNGAQDVLVESNEISDHHRWCKPDPAKTSRCQSGTIEYERPLLSDGRVDSSYKRADANAINLEGYGNARVVVRDNILSYNGGDGVQCLGVNDDSGPSPEDSSDLQLVDNHISSNVENAVDIKSCQRVTVRGTSQPVLDEFPTLPDNVFSGYRPTDPASDLTGNHAHGEAIVVHYAARGVLIEKTNVRKSCKGLSVGRPDRTVTNLVVRRTLFADIGSNSVPMSSDCKGDGIGITRAANVDLYHNTFDVQNRAVALANGNPGQVSNVDLFNSIMRTQGSHSSWIAAYKDTAGFESSYNLFWTAGEEPVTTRHFTIGAPEPDGTVRWSRVDWKTWRDQMHADAEGQSRHGDPLFNSPGTWWEYYPVPGSPAGDAALLIDNYFCGEGPDMGFGDSVC